MAIYHFHVAQISRGKGQTAVSAAAYRAGEKLHDNYYGEEPDYTKKGGVLYTEIILPEHAPREYADRETLWNAVEFAEANGRAQLAYSFNFALPNELSDEENLELVRKFILENFTSRGMISDMAIHKPAKSPGDIPNPHVHVLVPMRPLKEDGTWGNKQRREYILDENGERIKGADGKYLFNAVKTTDWGAPETLEQWRANWAKAVNDALEKKGFSERIDHRSNAERGLDALPTIHEGPAVRAMEKRGIRTEKGEWNRYIKFINQNMKKLLSYIAEIRDAIKELKHAEARAKGENGELSSALFFYLGKNTEKGYRAETKVKMTAEVLAFVEKYHITKLDDFQGVVTNLYNQVATLRKEIRELQAEKKGVEEMLRMYQQYKETLLVYKEWYAISNPKKKADFETAHQGELMRFHMAERVLKKNYPDMRIPVKALKRKSEELASAIKGSSPELERVKEEAKQAYKLKCRIADAYKQTQRNTKREEQSL